MINEENGYSFEILEETPIGLYQVHPRFKFQVIGYILPLLYEDSFFNMTQSGDEFSIMISSKVGSALQHLPFVVTIDKFYIPIKIYHHYHQIEDDGIVEYISTLFSRAHIPILYINSFNNNFVLVPIEDLDKVKTIINF